MASNKKIPGSPASDLDDFTADSDTAPYIWPGDQTPAPQALGATDMQAPAEDAGVASPGDPAPATIFNAIAAHPEYVAGTDRLDTDVIRAASTPLFAKVGAEGFYCAGIPSMKLGVALKVEDGNKRAAEPAILAVLRAIDAIGASELDRLSRFSLPQLLNTRDEQVGYLRTHIQF